MGLTYGLVDLVGLAGPSGLVGLVGLLGLEGLHLRQDSPSASRRMGHRSLGMDQDLGPRSYGMERSRQA